MSIVLDANAPEANCGPGVTDGAGFLALMNSGPIGARAWDVVSPMGVFTGNLMLGGDMAFDVSPQPSGFHVIRITPPGGLSMTVHSSEGIFVRSVSLFADDDVPSFVTEDPRGGELIAQWAPRTDGTQVLTFQFLDVAGLPRTQPIEAVSAPLSETRSIVAGVDTWGRALLLWKEPSTWKGQWWNRQGVPVTQPFSVPSLASTPPGGLIPLAGGGLAVQSNGQWVAKFPSGQAVAQPAPAWLASHPNTQLVLIRGQQANALVPPPVFVEDSGCQETLLLFARDGTACGELLLPPDGSTCFLRRLGIGPDGTVTQQIDLSAQSTNQCSWRWWPGLLQ
ncbi:hypothetical protein POL68_21800 [Stigmatella sp. ncwal1]|uniref:Uncharacterized protein n=1 Tax=Stigmatella ashevillensis TaxID=2995309 RepID=A0ABT5DDD3_9BACT|nr:hypothetical protein [Stigmatella ashevillena]MDC0711118.1 hypothetical protein [Stigmatella ashevillena]